MLTSMIRLKNRKNSQGISLIESMSTLAIFSVLVLPLTLLLMEYEKGASSTKAKFAILDSVEKKLEAALALPFNDIPEGKTSNVIIQSKNGNTLDLNTSTISNKKVNYECSVEVMPVNFSAVTDSSTRDIKSVKLENGLKKITISAIWGKGTEKQNIQLIAYKANL